MQIIDNEGIALSFAERLREQDDVSDENQTHSKRKDRFDFELIKPGDNLGDTIWQSLASIDDMMGMSDRIGSMIGRFVGIRAERGPVGLVMGG